MDKDNNNNSSNNFFSGFLLGVLAGAAIVFLLGTKKGKRIWKAISEEASKIEDLGEIKAVPKAKSPVQKEEVLPFIEEKPKVRRFFRGISRRVN